MRTVKMTVGPKAAAAAGVAHLNIALQILIMSLISTAQAFVAVSTLTAKQKTAMQGLIASGQAVLAAFGI